MKGLFTTLKRLILLACVLVALFAVVGYAAGWVKVRHDEQRETTTIELNSGELKSDIKDAVGQGKEMIEGDSEDTDDAQDPQADAEDEDFTGETAPPKEYDDSGAASPH